MKRLLMLSLFCFGLSLSISATVESNKDSFVSHCSNFTTSRQAVSYSYLSCVNRNFNSLAREFDTSVYTSHCSNFGNGVSYSFTSCINNNFRTLARHLDNSVYLPSCNSFNNDELSYSFVSCTNNNFQRVQRELNNQ